MTKNIGADQSVWKCTSKEGNVDYEVEVFGTGPSDITMVRATALVYSGSTNSTSKDFLGYAASLPYSGAMPESAKDWVMNNVGKNTSKVFGKVKFELFANSPKARIFILKVAK